MIASTAACGSSMFGMVQDAGLAGGLNGEVADANEPLGRSSGERAHPESSKRGWSWLVFDRTPDVVTQLVAGERHFW